MTSLPALETSNLGKRYGSQWALQECSLSIPAGAVTALVAFNAGARTERPEENGMAHFLEHLVFKGGEIYDDYRKVNETA